MTAPGVPGPAVLGATGPEEAEAMVAVPDPDRDPNDAPEGATADYPVLYPPDEPRRQWAILLNGNQQNVGKLLADLIGRVNHGSPGHWDTSQGYVVWVPAPPAPTGLDDPRPPRPLPVRDLLSNEIIQTGLMSVSVARTDLQQQNAQQSGSFLPEDRATLRGIYDIVSKLSPK